MRKFKITRRLFQDEPKREARPIGTITVTKRFGNNLDEPMQAQNDMTSDQLRRFFHQRTAGMLFVVTAGLSKGEVVQYTGMHKEKQIDKDLFSDISMLVTGAADPQDQPKRVIPVVQLRKPRVPELAILSFKARRALAKLKL